MSSRTKLAIAEQPTPEPSSAVVPSDGAIPLRIDPAAVPSLEDLPPEWRGNPFLRYLLEMTPEEEAHHAARSAAVEEGRRLYGDESSDAWLVALRNGTHPLCRVPEPTQR